MFSTIILGLMALGSAIMIPAQNSPVAWHIQGEAGDCGIEAQYHLAGTFPHNQKMNASEKPSIQVVQIAMMAPFTRLTRAARFVFSSRDQRNPAVTELKARLALDLVGVYQCDSGQHLWFYW